MVIVLYWQTKKSLPTDIEPIAMFPVGEEALALRVYREESKRYAKAYPHLELVLQWW